MTNALHHLVQQVGIIQLANKFCEVEILENLPRIAGERQQVGFQIGLDTRLTECGQIHLRGVVEIQTTGGPNQQLLLRLFRQFHFDNFFQLGKYGLLAWLQHAFQAAQQGKRQNNAPVLALLEVTAQ